MTWRQLTVHHGPRPPAAYPESENAGFQPM